MKVVRALRRLSHLCGEPALDRVRSWFRCIRSVRGTHIVSFNGAAEAPAERAGQRGCLWFKLSQCIGPGRVRLCLWASQESCSNLNRARAESKRGGDPATIADSAGGNNRNRKFVHQTWQQCEQAGALALRCGLIERASMSTCFKPLCDNYISSGAFGR